jgi:hypothetical protein
MPLGLGIEEWQKPEWRANQTYSAVGMAKLADHPAVRQVRYASTRAVILMSSIDNRTLMTGAS